MNPPQQPRPPTPEQQPQPPAAAATDALPNPYVGPRSFTARDPVEGRNLYGRDRELQELLQLLTVERIVLLFSPSGAGPTSPCCPSCASRTSRPTRSCGRWPASTATC
jgi:hypothetical protein